MPDVDHGGLEKSTSGWLAARGARRHDRRMHTPILLLVSMLATSCVSPDASLEFSPDASDPGARWHNASAVLPADSCAVHLEMIAPQGDGITLDAIAYTADRPNGLILAEIEGVTTLGRESITFVVDSRATELLAINQSGDLGHAVYSATAVPCD